MHVIMGATGHIGGALARRLIASGEPVTVVVHHEERAGEWARRGAEVAVADVHDTPKLRAAFSRGDRLFVLNPPAPPPSDTDSEERATVRSILDALRGLDPRSLVAQSTYGAQAGTAIGDLGSLYALEEGLRAEAPTSTIVRGAYYMSNWDSALDSARKEGVVHSFFPIDFTYPMVAPEDLAAFAARALAKAQTQFRIDHVEGPQRYNSVDVANVFAKVLARPVRAEEVPASERPGMLQRLGFSDAAARSFSGMIDVTRTASFPNSKEVEKGTTSLESYVTTLVNRRPKSGADIR